MATASITPAVFNDRLLLGLKGTMSEAELHILCARLNGGIRNKAARGELRRGLPVGFVWGEADGEVCFHPDEAVGTATEGEPWCNLTWIFSTRPIHRGVILGRAPHRATGNSSTSPRAVLRSRSWRG